MTNLTHAEQNFLELAPAGANVVMNGKLIRGEMTPAMSAALDLRARLSAEGDNLTDERADAISAEWRKDWPGMFEEGRSMTDSTERKAQIAEINRRLAVLRKQRAAAAKREAKAA